MIIITGYAYISYVKGTKEGRAYRRIPDFPVYLLFKPGNKVVTNTGYSTLYNPLQRP
jgi:hypothetical protein